MFADKTLKQLVELLKKRGACLFHACQYKDFLSYLSLGGVPSRARLESAGAEYTAFDSDRNDRESGAWELVFFNLMDFGNFFATGSMGTPTAYGPITVVLAPAALLEAQDVAVCPRSAGHPGFDRAAECLPSQEDVDSLFANPTDGSGGPAYYLKDARPEVSASYIAGFAGWCHARRILVEAVNVGAAGLLDAVGCAAAKAGLTAPAKPRFYKCAQRQQVLGDLCRLLADDSVRLEDSSAHPQVSGATRAWATQLQSEECAYQYARFAQYLRDGTLGPLSAAHHRERT